MAACWSPRTAVRGTATRSVPSMIVSPYSPEDGQISGSIPRGTPKMASSSSSQESVRRSISIVRLALVTSVTCLPPRAPPVRFQMSQLSIVPKHAVPARAASSTAPTFSSAHCSLPAEKYVAGGSPLFSRTSSPFGPRASSAAILSLRVSCHTIAFVKGNPVVRSQRTVVSLWFARPMAAKSAGPSPAAERAPRITAPVRSRISTGSCSTQPGFGKIWRCSS